MPPHCAVHLVVNNVLLLEKPLVEVHLVLKELLWDRDLVENFNLRRVVSRVLRGDCEAPHKKAEPEAVNFHREKQSHVDYFVVIQKENNCRADVERVNRELKEKGKGEMQRVKSQVF